MIAILRTSFSFLEHTALAFRQVLPLPRNFLEATTWHQATTMQTQGGTVAVLRPRMMCRSGLSKTEAENLLDWLEANGYQKRELLWLDGSYFTVRWRTF